MVRLKNKECQRIKASSLLEVMVALVIIFTIFAIAMRLYVNVLASSYTFQTVKSILEANKIAYQTKMHQTLLDADISAGNFIIEKKISPYPKQPGVAILELKIKNDQLKTVNERKELIIVE